MKRLLTFCIFISIARLSAAQEASQQPLPGTSYETVAGDAAWCWFSDPRAVYYKGRQERIYFSYITSDGDVVISARDMQTGKTETTILHEKLERDDHNVPSILFLPDGRILTFYTEHNGRFFMRRSRKPEAIDAWEEEQILPFGNRATYSHPVMLSKENNRIYLFWRGSDWQPSFSWSDDWGESWAKAQAFIAGEGLRNSDRPYLKVASDNKSRIDLVFTDGHPARETTNSVYHAYYERGAFYQTNGRLIGTVEELPLWRKEVDKVYDATVTGVRSWIADIALDDKKRPAIVYVRFPRETDHYYHYAYWNGKEWKDREMCRAGGWMPLTPEGGKTKEPHYSGGIALDHGNIKDVYLSRQVNGVFEIERWRKKKTGWQRRALTGKSPANNMRPFAVSGYPGKKAVVLWMEGDYYHYTRFETTLRINKSNNN